MATSPNKVYLASVLCAFAQIPLQGTSDTLETLEKKRICRQARRSRAKSRKAGLEKLEIVRNGRPAGAWRFQPPSSKSVRIFSNAHRQKKRVLCF